MLHEDISVCVRYRKL